MPRYLRTFYPTSAMLDCGERAWLESKELELRLRLSAAYLAMQRFRRHDWELRRGFRDENWVDQRKKTMSERLQDNSIPVTESGCWVWMGAVDGAGYGKMMIDGKGVGAHRQSWITFRGAIPSGLHVLHRCDVPPCINPDHLFLGTHQDNMADRKRKNRYLRSPITALVFLTLAGATVTNAAAILWVTS